MLGIEPVSDVQGKSPAYLTVSGIFSLRSESDGKGSIPRKLALHPFLQVSTENQTHFSKSPHPFQGPCFPLVKGSDYTSNQHDYWITGWGIRQGWVLPMLGSLDK